MAPTTFPSYESCRAKASHEATARIKVSSAGDPFPQPARPRGPHHPSRPLPCCCAGPRPCQTCPACQLADLHLSHILARTCCAGPFGGGCRAGPVWLVPLACAPASGFFRHLVQPGFPFLSNLQLHALAAGLELACATACVVYRGKSLPSLLILGLVLSMLWYHWALGFHGYRKSCGCLGYFGRLLGLPLWTDRLVPFAGLSLLALCAWPALCMRAPWPARAWLPLHPGHALHLVSHPPQRKASAVRPERLGSGCHKVFHWFVRLLLSGFNPVAARRWAVAAEALRNNNRHLRSGPSTRRNIFRAPTRTVHRIGLPGRAEGPSGCLENKTPKTEKKRP